MLRETADDARCYVNRKCVRYIEYIRTRLSVEYLLGLFQMSSHDSPACSVAEWYRASPRDAVEWFARASVPWWVAGGWAIDLFLNRSTRQHHDLDVGVLRRDIGEILRSIEPCETFEAKDGS